ncbi:MAG: glucose-6-phosphate dehydrogenase [Actinomycetota bacterium]
MARELRPQAVVIFGASGDLTKRKLLPAFYHLFLQGLLPKGFAIVGYARTEMTDEAFVEDARDHVRRFSRHVPEGEVWADFSRHLSYCPGSFSDPMAMKSLVQHLEGVDERHGTHGGRFFYAATPPAAYPDIVQRLGEVGLHRDAKIVIEKPFGRDLASARELNAAIHEVFDESQIFRIDHYLGKENVQNILAFRFANGMFEPIWNRRYIDHVQITVAESIGIEGRGAFYEQTGTIRDMVSTHLFQVMTFVAMEPPVAFEPDRLRDETVKALRATQACRPDRVIRGQYRGYRDEEGVSDGSTVETFSAMELHVDNWRWAGVPFYLRTGKALRQKVSEITLKFRKVPFNVFKGTDIELAKRDHLTIRIQPNEGITIAFNAKRPGPGMNLGRVTMEFDYAEDFPQQEIADAYELLLLEAMRGDHSLFIRQDGVERAWEILQPVLEHPSPIRPYDPGSWGPPEVDALIAPRKWHVSGEHDAPDYPGGLPHGPEVPH